MLWILIRSASAEALIISTHNIGVHGQIRQELSHDSIACLSCALTSCDIGLVENFKISVTKFWTPKAHCRVKLWGMVLQNVTLCYDIIMFQTWKSSVEWLLKYE